ncbi:MAG: J domain-containing protein [Candidatus Limnocylindrales bacterium]
MAPEVDPYRTLGLGRGASIAEVKRAYRSLAKANHPDAAGEAALPRFLAIRAAYDQIIGPAGDGTGAAGRSGGAGRRASGPRPPWDADPNRTDATHRAYGGRPRRARPTGPRPASESARPADAGSSSRTRAPRDSKKATLGSTSYDGADAEPFEPDWGGASWYGTTSGTYWTLNPKEYADPRKHGPEYQARARRSAEAAADAEAAEAAEAVEPTGSDRPAPAAEPARATGADAASVPPTHTTTSWWDATAADPAAPVAAAAPAPDPPPPPNARPDGGLTVITWDATRFLEPAAGGIIGRVGRGVVGWTPIALGIGWLAGEITGCARFSASCDASSAPLAWFAQVVVLALLLIVPRLAVAATIATIGTLAAAIPGSLLVTSMGAAADVGSARSALGALLVIGWSVGIVVGLGREVRRLRVPGATSPDQGSGPVS